MGDGSQIGEVVGDGLGLLVDAAVAGAVIKGVSNLANEVGHAGPKKKGFEGVKPMKMIKVKTPKIPKAEKVKTDFPKFKGGKSVEVPKVKGPEKFTPKTADVKKFVPKQLVPKAFRPKPFKLNTKVGF